VTNAGPRDGAELVQLYFRDPVAEVTRPLLELLDWTRLELPVGQTGTARFNVAAHQFGYYGRDLRFRVDEGEIILYVGPDSARLAPVTVGVVGGRVWPSAVDSRPSDAE
jgi:beta-glucosidase